MNNEWPGPGGAQARTPVTYPASSQSFMTSYPTGQLPARYPTGQLPARYPSVHVGHLPHYLFDVRVQPPTTLLKPINYGPNHFNVLAPKPSQFRISAPNVVNHNRISGIELLITRSYPWCIN